VGFYYDAERHPAASLIVSRCNRAVRHVKPNGLFLACPLFALFAGKVAIDGLFFLSIEQKSFIVVMGDTKL